MKVPAFLSSLRRRFRRRENGSEIARQSGKQRGRSFPRVEALERFMLLSGSTISGFVYLDGNNNGAFEPGETPVANNTIELFNSSGVEVGTTTTDANGFYQFTTDSTIDTAPRTIIQSASLADTATNFANSPLQQPINQFNPALGTLTSVDVVSTGKLTSAFVAENLDVALPATISGTVSGTITLNGPGISLPETISQTSPTQTAPKFDGVEDLAGTDTVSFSQSGTTAPALPTTLTDPNVLASFIGTGQVSGLSVTGVAASGVSSDRNLNTQITTTGADAVTFVYHYIPSNALTPGAYKVVQPNEPAGTINGKDSSGGVVLPLNNPATQGPDTIPITLGATNSVNNNFGELLPAALSGFVYFDKNNNGLYEPAAGETPFSGQTVTLTGTDDTGPIAPVSLLTDANGFYSFGSLRPGNYTVTDLMAPAGFTEGLKALDNVPIPGSNATTSIVGIAPGQGVTIPNNNFGNIATVCPPPTIGLIQRFGVHMQPTEIVLTFSEALDPASAQNLNNYRLVGPGRDGRIGPNDFTIIPIRSATYNAANNTVTLVPSRNLNVHHQFFLTVRGTSGGVAASCGTLLDGNGTGAGTNYSHVVDRTILAGFTDHNGNPVTVVNGQIPHGVAGLPPSASLPYSPRPSQPLSPTVVDQVLATGVNASDVHSLRVHAPGLTAAKVRAITPHSARSSAAIDHLLAHHSGLGKRHG